MAITLRDMLAAGVHFGHRTRYWNPKMAPYIYGARNDIHIINLEKTLPLYHEALNFITKVIANKGKVLFVGTKSSAQDVVREQAQRCGMPYVDHRWLGGMLTNYKTVRQSIKRLKNLEELRDSGAFEKMLKKEALQMKRKLIKLERSLGGIKEMNGIPDAIFVLDVGYENISITEARKLKIPVIGIVDTNHSPDGIDYVIPGNDDSMRAITLYLTGIADAIVTIREATGTMPQDEIAAEEARLKTKPKTTKTKTAIKTQKATTAEVTEDTAEDQIDKTPAKAAAQVNPAVKAKATKTTKSTKSAEAPASKVDGTKAKTSKQPTTSKTKPATKTTTAKVAANEIVSKPTVASSTVGSETDADDTKVEVK